MTFFVFQLDISGNEINALQSSNMADISVALDIFHLDISGNSFNEEHLLNI